MQNQHKDILIKNISKLMKDNNMTQSALADILEMNQSNVSKALSPNDKKSFTLEQVIGIAKYFRVSIDSLVGNISKSPKSIKPRPFAEFLVRLIESDTVKVFKHPVEEDVFEPYIDDYSGAFETNHIKRTVPYNAFYIPSYWHIEGNVTREEENEIYYEMSQIGNETIHRQTNKFLHNFLQIRDSYKQGMLEEETYHTVIEDLLNHLKD